MSWSTIFWKEEEEEEESLRSDLPSSEFLNKQQPINILLKGKEILRINLGRSSLNDDFWLIPSFRCPHTTLLRIVKDSISRSIHMVDNCLFDNNDRLIALCTNNSRHSCWIIIIIMKKNCTFLFHGCQPKTSRFFLLFRDILIHLDWMLLKAFYDYGSWRRVPLIPEE